MSPSPVIVWKLRLVVVEERRETNVMLGVLDKDEGERITGVDDAFAFGLVRLTCVLELVRTGRGQVRTKVRCELYELLYRRLSFIIHSKAQPRITHIRPKTHNPMLFSTSIPPTITFTTTSYRRQTPTDAISPGDTSVNSAIDRHHIGLFPSLPLPTLDLLPPTMSCTMTPIIDRRISGEHGGAGLVSTADSGQYGGDVHLRYMELVGLKLKQPDLA